MNNDHDLQGMQASLLLFLHGLCSQVWRQGAIYIAFPLGWGRW